MARSGEPALLRPRRPPKCSLTGAPAKRQRRPPRRRCPNAPPSEVDDDHTQNHHTDTRLVKVPQPGRSTRTVPVWVKNTVTVTTRRGR